ncbi:MFS transporter [Planomonospora parontospora]|uniref:MFS transporter n=1 Tax=Planomonospora parontospora TaxID=58119 RepID=UPI001670E7B4|nr:MFS transporter [Planomonospora parontospora]GGL26866.1 MFS transporter [Planomonospora parontospora subsp. antibiotica]GII16152.1 MFS transporter [Planomonospora parontospora subsp. antibiotica]
MVGPYRELFSTPGVKGFVISGFVGRMPMSMLGLGIIVLVETLTGSYGMAGAVAATVSVSYAVAAPFSGRLVDKFGQARVIVPLTFAHGSALIALMLCAQAGAPAWTLFASGLVAGATAVSLGALVRARWAHVLSGSDRLHTAFSFESVADEVIFVAGPALATSLATMVNPYVGLIVVVVCALVGTVAFALQRGSEPPVLRGGTHSGTPITIPGVALLSCVFLGMGAVFGSVDLITVAFAEERGAPVAGGLLLSALAAGSLVSGLWYGARPWKLSLRTRFVRALGTFAAGLTPVFLVGDLRVMAVALFVAGLSISPTIITGYALIERLVPARLLTEGMSWLSTAIGFGVALGAWAAGRLTDLFGASNAYAFPFLCALLAAAVGVAGSTWLRTPVAEQKS